MKIHVQLVKDGKRKFGRHELKQIAEIKNREGISTEEASLRWWEEEKQNRNLPEGPPEVEVAGISL